MHFLYKPRVTDAVGWDHLAKTTALGNCLFSCSLIPLQLGRRGGDPGFLLLLTCSVAVFLEVVLVGIMENSFLL